MTVQGPLTMQTDATPPISFKVTSQDFGGKAYLRTALTLAPGVPPIYVEIVDANGQDVTPPADNAATKGTCGTDFTQGPFASLSVDQDCNGIADSWEDQNSPQTDAQGVVLKDAQGNIMHRAPDWDQEPGYLPTSPKGDGWSVHDEYRGFHYVADDGTTVKWVSTDPAHKVDVFFWDTSVVPNHQARNTTYSFTQALRGILCLQGSADEMARGTGAANCANGANEANAQLGVGANPLTYLYRRVNPQQAHAAYPDDAKQGVKPFNGNSATAQANNALYHYVVVYNSVLQAKDLLDAASAYNLVNIVTGKLSAFSLVFGLTQLLQSPPGSPLISMKRIDVDTRAIMTFLSHPALRGFPQPTLLAEVVAHETGHLFGRLHSMRPSWLSYAAAATENNFTFPNNNNTTSKTIDVLLQQPYTFKTLKVPPEDVAFPDSTTSAGTEGGSGKKTLGSTYYPPGTYLYPFQVTNPNGVSNSDHPWVQTQIHKLMDWMPYLYLQTPAQWQFDASDLAKLCAKVPCK